MPAWRSSRIWRSTSVTPPSSTRHFGDSFAVPFNREPLPAARMIPRITQVPRFSRGRERPATNKLDELRGVERAISSSNRNGEEQRQIEQAASACLKHYSQKRAR